MSTLAVRRQLHPEIDWPGPSLDTGTNVHPKQVGVRYIPKWDCECNYNRPCTIHDPVEADGDWDA